MGAEPAQQSVAAREDVELARRACAGEDTAFRIIMERHNRRLYRLARSIVRDNSEAEDVVQEAYVNAYAHLGRFRGDASLSTWLSRITLNEALARLRHRGGRTITETKPPAAQILQFPLASAYHDPERIMAQRQILRLVEQAFDQMPEIFRTVFMARVIEGMSIEETAETLGLKPETVKTRLHRARQLLRDQLEAQVGSMLMDAFPFAGKRCECLTRAVLQRLSLPLDSS